MEDFLFGGNMIEGIVCLIALIVILYLAAYDFRG